MTIEELLQRHFLVGTGKGWREDPGRAMTEAEASDICARLTPRQRAALRDDVLDALDALFAEAAAVSAGSGGNFRYSLLGQLKALDWWKGQRAPEREQSWCAVVIVHRLLDDAPNVDTIGVPPNHHRRTALQELLRERLGKRPLRLDPAQVILCLESSWRHGRGGEDRFDYMITEPTIKSALAIAPADVALDPNGNDAAMLRKLRDQYVRDGYGASSRAYADWLGTVLGQEEQELLWPGEAWAKQINEAIASLPAKKHAAAVKLLKHAGTANEYSKPNKAWFAEAQKLIEQGGRDEAGGLISSWLRVFAGDERQVLIDFQEQYGNRHADRRAVNGPKLRGNSGYMIGVAYIARLVADAAIIALLADVVERIARARHAVREHSATVAVVALRSIEASDDPSAAAAALSRLMLRLRWPKLRKAAEKSFEQFLARSGLSRDDAEEAAVPDFGMTDGVVRMAIGSDSHAELSIGRSTRPRTAWLRPGKEPTHVVPKALKQAHPAEVKAVADAADEIEKMLAAQRTRIDLLFRREMRWPYDAWQARYLNHGLLGTLVRRLIWVIDDIPLLYVAGAWEDARGAAVKVKEKSASVALWHPASRSADEVLAWRQRLEALGITQPIKQAHREVYLLTDAERRTRTYSNRYAAHIVRNHTTLAISQVRKWKMGMYGGDSSPSLALPHFKLRAEWWTQPAGDDHDRMGFPLYLQSDQVRFYREGEADPMPLEEVPLLAFTEVMRDIDLFVGIASVGNDPAWQDGGPENRYRDYWHDYSFGELAETARTRRAVLERLVPRLKIAPRCSVNDKFLVVKGDIRSYKIHLGSGNILMTPNDQYLCIVADRGSSSRSTAAGDVFLPFEGDATLSIILSKAFLLANDTKIEDPTITRQIGG